jgi:DNA primase
LDSLLAAGLAIRVAVVPAPHDPDSFIKECGGGAFRQLTDQAEGFFDYYLNRLCATNDLNTDKGRLAVVQAMAEAAHKTGNVVLVDKYAQKTALRLGVSPEAMRAEFKKAARSKRASLPDANVAGGTRETGVPPGDTVPAPADEPRPTTPEYWLLKLLLLHEDTLGWTQAHLDLDWLQSPRVREIVGLRFAAQAGDAWRGVAAFLGEFDAVETRCLITEAAAEDRAIPNPTQQLGDIVLRLRNQFIDRELASLSRSVGQSDLGEEERLEALRRQQALRHLKRQPLAPIRDADAEPF